MGGACGGCGGVENCRGVGWENLEGKRPIGTPVVDGRLTLTLSLLMSYIYSGASVHELIFRAKNVSDDERFLGLRTRKLRVSARESVAG
jgi:hypothetical protein